MIYAYLNASLLALDPLHLRLDQPLQLPQRLLHPHLQPLQNRRVLLTNALFGLLAYRGQRQRLDD